MKMNKRVWMVVAMCIACGMLTTASAAKPNFIVIMADDLGYADVGFNGGRQIPTPHIDSIAENGVMCSSAYASYAVCGPSRAGFMTGRYEQRFGFERNPQYRPDERNMGLPRSERTIAEALKPAGYTSGIIGKWHLGAHESLHPLNRGFDFFFGHLGGGHQYFPEMLTIKDSYSIDDEYKSYHTWILRDHEPVQITKYLTDEFSDEAVKFIDRNKDNPFFLFLSYNAPHAPVQAPEKVIARFSDIPDKKRRTYAAMVSVMDEGVGRVLDKVKALGLDDNTVIFFLSDNGGPTNANASDNSPLRGQKSDVWEGGFRVPYAVQWKGMLPVGAVYDNPVSSLDIFATVTSLAGAPPADPERPLDGVNLVPFLSGADSGIPHDAIYLRKFDQDRFAVRRGDYKLVIMGPDENPQLFNLGNDIGETENIADVMPEKARQLDALRKAWAAELVYPVFLGLMHTPDSVRKYGPPRKWLEGDTRNTSAKKESATGGSWQIQIPADLNEFLRVNKIWAKKDAGWNPTEEALTQRFHEIDRNGDGELDQAEWNARKESASSEKAAPPVQKKPAPFDLPVSKERFIKKNREWAQNPKTGWNFDQAKAEARFDEWDTDGDGMLSQEEWDAR